MRCPILLAAVATAWTAVYGQYLRHIQWVVKGKVREVVGWRTLVGVLGMFEVGASLPHGLAGLARGASLATAERLRPPAYAQPRQVGHHLADRTPPSAAIAGASAIGAALRRWLTGEAPSYANTENGPLLAWSRGAARKVLSSRLMCPRSPNYISANHEKPMRVKCRWRNADRLIEKSLMTACAHRVKFGTVAPAES